MNNLNELIGKNVLYMLNVEGVIFEEIKTRVVDEVECKVIGVNIDDYYFEEKNEEIYIELKLEPLEPYLLDGLIDFEDLDCVPLSSIRRV